MKRRVERNFVEKEDRRAFEVGLRAENSLLSGLSAKKALRRSQDINLVEADRGGTIKSLD